MSYQVVIDAVDQLPAIYFRCSPRSFKLRQLVAEFGSFVTLGVNPQHAEYLEHKLAQFPKGTKALSRQLVTWDVIRVETAAVDNF